MDRERFNTLLLDPSKVTNADIKALNEYRKKYPYFQSLYVVIAKALKDREHAKTDAFIKKAAIYSANRAHLKSIIEGDYTFPEKKEEVKKQPKPVTTKPKEAVKAPEPQKETTPKASAPTPSKKPVQKSGNEEKPLSVKKPETKVPVVPAVKKTEKPTPARATKKVPKKPIQADISPDLSSDLEEIRAAKKRIETLLAGSPSSTESSKGQRKSSSKTHTKGRPNQVELIEKFIQNEPQIERQKASEKALETGQEDLASKTIKPSEAFETETLAQLMFKQGKYKKALSIYEKLRLKFPEKSAYFASQIEEIKSKQNV